jgi:hypothetical protein
MSGVKSKALPDWQAIALALIGHQTGFGQFARVNNPTNVPCLFFTAFCFRVISTLQWDVGVMSRVQQHGYLSSEERAAFQSYAGSMSLDASGLASLLLVRELRAKRLSTLPAHRPPVPDRMKVTAHLANADIKSAFAAHARERGQTPCSAAAQLFRAELRERWLEQILDSN